MHLLKGLARKITGYALRFDVVKEVFYKVHLRKVPFTLLVLLAY